MSALRVVDLTRAARARRSLAGARLLWVGASGLLSLGLTVAPFAETGSWAPLAVGRVIIAHGIPVAEPFSYFTAVQPWVAAGWLRAVLLAALFGAGGATLASIALGIASSTGLVLAALSVRPNARIPAAWLAAGVLAAALVARPLLQGGVPILLLGTGAVLYILARSREGESRLLWVLPPVFLLWANLDTGFTAGLLLLLIAWAAESRTRAAFRRTLLLVTLAGAVAAVVNPAGVGLYQWIASTAGGPVTAALSPAFAPPDFHDTSLRVFEAVAAVLVISWVAGGGFARLDGILAISALGLALWSQQFVPLFAVVAAPQLGMYSCRAWQRALEPRLSETRPAASLRALGGILNRLGPPLVAGAALTAVAVASIAAVARQASPNAAAAAESTREPQAAANRVAATLPGQRVYAPSNWSDYLVYRFPTGRVVSIYLSGGGFTVSAATTYETIRTASPGWETAVRGQKVQVAIVDDRSTVASGLHELGWAAACFDSSSGALVMTAPGAGAPSTPSSTLTVPPAGVPAC